MPRRSAVVAGLVLVLLAALTPSQGAWLASAVGGAGARSTSVGPGLAPSATVSVRSVALSWSLSALQSGAAVSGYLVRRYAAGTTASQPVTSGSCATALVAATSCSHDAVPAGSWGYTVTPTIGAWRGPESPAVVVTVAAPGLTSSASGAVRPGTTVTGTLTGMVPGGTVTYRLDSATGPVLSGTLAGSATPATVPASGGGTVTAVVPVGTSDGLHTLFAVSAPSGETATTSVVVDGTAPPAPVLTRTPASPSSDSVTFEFTQADSADSLQCTLDGAAYALCSSPLELVALASGSHTLSVQTTDAAGNPSAAASHTWTVSLSVPSVAISFPAAGSAVNDAGFSAGCGTAGGDVCGAADDDDGIVEVAVSLRQSSTGLYWTGLAFAGAAETFLPAAGTLDWSYAIAAVAFPAEGAYVLRARATDGSGSVGFDSRSFTVDRTAPAAPVFSTAPTGTTGPDTTAAWSSADSTAGSECQLDGGAWTSCTSPRSLLGLADGAHVLAVRAVDRAGNLSAATSTSWTVDAVAPTVAITSPVAGTLTPAAWTAGCGTPTTGDACGTSADARSGTAAVGVSVRSSGSGLYLSGGSFSSTSEVFAPASGTATWTYALAASALPDGTYVLRARATDAVGNAATTSVTVVLDSTPPPAPVLLSAPTSPGGSSAVLQFSLPEAGTTAQCRLDAAAFAACTSPLTYTGLAAGTHTVQLRAVDPAGNLSTVVATSWVVDPDLPTVEITSPAAGRVYSPATFDAACGTAAGDVCGTASDPQGLASVQVSVRSDSTGRSWDGAAFVAGAERWLTASGLTAWSLPLPGAALPDEGGYTVRARATDTGGNLVLKAAAFTVDRTAPAVPVITSGPSGTTGGTDSFTWTVEAGASALCLRDGAAATSCTSPLALTSANGPRTFTVQAVDAAGNVGPAATRSWTVDTVAPVVAVTFPAAGGRYNDATFTLGCSTSGTSDVCGTASDATSPVSSVQVALQRASTGTWWNGSSFAATAPVWLAATGTTSWSLAVPATGFPADDTYVLQARATDAPGNTSTPVLRSFAIDRTGPVATAVSAVNRGTVAQRIETGDQLVLVYSEPVAPGSIIAGWNGLAPQNVVVRQANRTSDPMTVYDGANQNVLPLGSVQLRRNDYVSGAVVWGASGSAVRSTVSISGSTLTITFGTPDQPGRVTTALGTGNLNWRPVAGATDLAGNTASVATRAEVDNDGDF